MNTTIPLDRNQVAQTGGGREPLRDGPTMRTVTSEELFRGTNEIAIKHGGSFYRLKITRQGKLILNK